MRGDGASLSDNRGGPWGPAAGTMTAAPAARAAGRATPGASGGASPAGGGGGSGERAASLDEFLRRSRERFGGGLPRDGRPYLALRPDRLPRCCGSSSPASSGSARRSAASSPPSAIIRGRWGPASAFPGRGRSAASPRSTSRRSATIPIPGSGENLILTGDQNVIDLAYSVRWNIKQPELFLFQIADPDATIREVAESAMRAAVARVSLDDAIGAGRADIEQRVEQAMQQLLDDYGSRRPDPGRRDQPVGAAGRRSTRRSSPSPPPSSAPRAR